MVEKRSEAHRALELLEEYHARLNQPSHRQLKEAIERVIQQFKTGLFQALLDIQEYYDDTLANDRKTLDQKLYETQQIAAKWENNGGPLAGRSTSKLSSNSFGAPLPSNSSYQRQQYNYNTSQMSTGAYNNGTSTSYPRPTNLVGSRPDSANALNGAIANVNLNATNRWEEEDIVLEKGTTGLGFSIAGGSDNPHVGDDPAIYVTKVIPGGAAYLDGRLKQGDIIIRVNGIDTENVPHHVCVEALKRAGNVVALRVRRPEGASPGLGPPPPVPNIGTQYTTVSTPAPHASQTNLSHSGFGVNVLKIDLVKNYKGLGFSVAGGVDNEHVPGDTGIFVTRIIEGGAAHHDGRLQPGDKLIAVGPVSLENVTHEQAVETLKTTPSRVTISYIKNPYPGVNPNNLSQDDFMRTTTPQSFSHQQSAYRPTTPQGYGAHQTVSMPEPQRYAGPMGSSTPTEQYAGLHRQPRTIQLQKGPNGLGFNIVGGEDGDGIFISAVMPGGVAELSGQVHRGDQLLQVNNISLLNATHEQAASALKNSGPYVQLVCQYKPEEYERFEQRIQLRRDEFIGQQQYNMQEFPPQRKEMYIRALFDYDGSVEHDAPMQPLSFNYGDILHVINAGDLEWWRARRVNADLSELGEGIIPSKARVERKERARRKKVEFGQGRSGSTSSLQRGSSRQLSFSRKFPFMKSKEALNVEDPSAGVDEPIVSYELVVNKQLEYRRPIIVIGPLKEYVQSVLTADSPNYTACVPHTSRAPRAGEIHGRDYFFSTRQEIENDIQNHQFVEAGQYNNNLYGTKISSVQAVANSGKHCVLDVSGNAIRRLQAANLFPIAIFTKPNNWTQLMEWNRQLSEEDAQHQYVKWQAIESEFAEYFTAIATGWTREDVMNRVRQIIYEQSQQVVWLPSRQPL